MPKGLPRNAYVKRGAYYITRNGNEIRLGRDLSAAAARWSELRPRLRKEAQLLAVGRAIQGGSLELRLRRLFDRCRRNAAGARYRRAKDFKLRLEDVFDMHALQHGRCAISGIPFDEETDANSKLRPFAVSIDRIDSALGYSRENCRLVCLSVNYAMNRWGESVLRKIAVEMMKR